MWSARKARPWNGRRGSKGQNEDAPDSARHCGEESARHDGDIVLGGTICGLNSKIHIYNKYKEIRSSKCAVLASMEATGERTSFDELRR